jgi:hypothetical protein
MQTRWFIAFVTGLIVVMPAFVSGAGSGQGTTLAGVLRVGTLKIGGPQPTQLTASACIVSDGSVQVAGAIVAPMGSRTLIIYTKGGDIVIDGSITFPDGENPAPLTTTGTVHGADAGSGGMLVLVAPAGRILMHGGASLGNGGRGQDVNTVLSSNQAPGRAGAGGNGGEVLLFDSLTQGGGTQTTGFKIGNAGSGGTINSVGGDPSTAAYGGRAGRAGFVSLLPVDIAKAFASKLADSSLCASTAGRGMQAAGLPEPVGQAISEVCVLLGVDSTCQAVVGVLTSLFAGCSAGGKGGDSNQGGARGTDQGKAPSGGSLAGMVGFDGSPGSPGGEGTQAPEAIGGPGSSGCPGGNGGSATNVGGNGGKGGDGGDGGPGCLLGGDGGLGGKGGDGAAGGHAQGGAGGEGEFDGTRSWAGGNGGDAGTSAGVGGSGGSGGTGGNSKIKQGIGGGPGGPGGPGTGGGATPGPAGGGTPSGNNGHFTWPNPGQAGGPGSLGSNGGSMLCIP